MGTFLPKGMRGIFKNKLLCAIGQKYGKTAAQVMLRWNVQRGVAVIPKSVHQGTRSKKTSRIWDFILDEQDMEAIAHMDEGHG